jgi:hypothetical protein
MNRISTPGELPPGYRYAYHDDDRQPTVWIVDAGGHAVTPVCDDEYDAWAYLIGCRTETEIAINRLADSVNAASRAVLDELTKYVERLESFVQNFTNRHNSGNDGGGG